MKIKRTKFKFISEEDEKNFNSEKKLELEISYQLKRIADCLKTIVEEA